MKLLSKGSMRMKKPSLNKSYMPRVHRGLRSRTMGVGSMKRKLTR